MYKILISIILMLSTYSGAMAQGAGYYSDQIDSSYRYLDKSRIQTGALYDRVFPWADLVAYTASDTVDYQYVKQAWYELYLSKYDRTFLHDVSYLHDRVTRNDINNMGISLGYIDFGMQYIDSNAILDSALVLNLNDSLLRDGNLSLNPYGYSRIRLPVIS